jgi:hypothetical protein
MCASVDLHNHQPYCVKYPASRHMSDAGLGVLLPPLLLAPCLLQTCRCLLPCPASCVGQRRRCRTSTVQTWTAMSSSLHALPAKQGVGLVQARTARMQKLDRLC